MLKNYHEEMSVFFGKTLVQHKLNKVSFHCDFGHGQLASML